MVFRNFGGTNVLSGRTPTGRERWFSGILAVDLEKFYPKTAEAENSPLGPGGKKGVRWNMKILSVSNFMFFVGWKNKMLVETKNLLVEKLSVGEFPLPKTDMSGMSGIPCNARPKNGRGGKKTP